jgi:hypothetical protein
MMPPSSYRRPCLWLIVVAGPAVLQLERHNGSGLCCAAAAWSSSPHNVVVALSVRRRRTMPAASVPVYLPAARNDDDDHDGSVDDDEDKDGRNGRSNRKFTGRSSRLFENEATAKDTARKIPYEREMNLASRFEQTLPLQALLLAMAIAFVAYVGLSGGITDGSERYFFDDEPSWTQSVPYPNDDVTTTTTDSVYI